jgi:hypothetical protein
MRIGRGLGVALIATTLGACATKPSATTSEVDSPRTGDTPVVHQRWTSCFEEAPSASFGGSAEALELPRLRADFVPTAAVVCDLQSERREDGGEDLVAIESRAEDVTVLAAALRLPAEPRTDGACRSDLPTIPWLALLDTDGRWVRPGAPMDPCGKIRIEVRDAIAALALTRVASRTVREIESAEAAAAGCSQTWKDMVAVVSRDNPPPGATGAHPLGGRTQVRLCVYRVPVSEQGSGTPAGQFERGGVLSAQRWAAIEPALRAADAASTCSTPAARFALLRAADGSGGEVYVELDECRRILTTPATGGAHLAQGDAALIALLNAAQPAPSR